MPDVWVSRLAEAQFNRFSRAQLHALGLSDDAVDHRVATGRWVIVEQGVFAIAPVLDDQWGRWMGATLTAPGTVLGRAGAGGAWGFAVAPRRFVTVIRPGSGGPRRLGGIREYRSATLDGECAVLRGIPITSVPRTLLDLANDLSARALARAVREAVRLQLTTVPALADYLGPRRTRRGARRLAATLARYTGLPLERARSGAEVRALELIRDANYALPRLNARIAGKEADLSWAAHRYIVEIDGGPFHLDAGENARKQDCWEAAGWTVTRLDAADVYDRPDGLIALLPPNVPR
jgi:very-short-patch-repair endonuclease